MHPKHRLWTWFEIRKTGYLKVFKMSTTNLNIPSKLPLLYIQNGVVLPGVSVRFKISSPSGYVSPKKNVNHQDSRNRTLCFETKISGCYAAINPTLIIFWALQGCTHQISSTKSQYISQYPHWDHPGWPRRRRWKVRNWNCVCCCSSRSHKNAAQK